MKFARACSSYECFILRARRLSSKLLKQGYLVELLKSSFRKFYGWYGDLIQQYEVSLLWMLNDPWRTMTSPNQSDFPTISWPWYRLWPSSKYEWFPWSICNGCGMPAGNAYPSGHLVPSPYFGTCLCSNCWDQIIRTCHVFTRLFTSNTLWYILDFAYMLNFMYHVCFLWHYKYLSTSTVLRVFCLSGLSSIHDVLIYT